VRRLVSFCGDLVVFFAVIAAFLLPFVLSGIVLALGALAVISGFDL
jgi:hypothetical protein